VAIHVFLSSSTLGRDTNPSPAPPPLSGINRFPYPVPVGFSQQGALKIRDKGKKVQVCSRCLCSQGLQCAAPCKCLCSQGLQCAAPCKCLCSQGLQCAAPCKCLCSQGLQCAAPCQCLCSVLKAIALPDDSRSIFIWVQ
jgi:hypothetical protein